MASLHAPTLSASQRGKSRRDHPDGREEKNPKRRQPEESLFSAEISLPESFCPNAAAACLAFAMKIYAPEFLLGKR
jgi:hypothetical protein